MNACRSTHRARSRLAALALLAPLASCQYVLGIDPIADESEPDPADRRACLGIEGYDPDPDTGIRYRVDGERVMWHTARDRCADDEAHLVTLEDTGENTFVTGLISETVWMGLSDEDDEGDFVWVTGEPLGAFFNWSEGEPNNANNEDYGELRTSGQWNDAESFSFNPFVCECPP